MWWRRCGDRPAPVAATINLAKIVDAAKARLRAMPFLRRGGYTADINLALLI
jgi:hypothetical protein